MGQRFCFRDWNQTISTAKVLHLHQQIGGDYNQDDIRIRAIEEISPFQAAPTIA